jgi:LysM repeat protein
LRNNYVPNFWVVKHKGYFLLALFIMLFQAEVSAQFEPAPVTRSEVIETINGKAYYIHTVKQGQTLFSIARAYEVTPQAIASENPEFPDLIEVVRTGQVIRIPRTATVQPAQRPATQATSARQAPTSGQPSAAQPPQIMRATITVTEFAEHEVGRRETLYGIARKYNISQEEILHFNPEARSGLRFRQVLQIPRRITRPVDYFYYTVAPGETNFGLSCTFWNNTGRADCTESGS